MKNNIELYLTEFAPNGTNDLLIVDGNTGEVKECIEGASFGYPRNTRIKPNAALYSSEFVGGLPEDGESLNYEAGDLLLYSVDLDVLRSHFCVSPVDPDGANLRSRLEKAGINLNKGGE